MKITSITVTRGITINTGNFTSHRLEITMVAELNGDHDEGIASMNLNNMVLDELALEINKLNVPDALKLAHASMINR